MRILTITHSYPMHPGDGTAPFVAATVEGLAARGHSVDVMLPEHPRLGQADDDRIHFVRYRYSPVTNWAPWGYGNTLHGDSRTTHQAALAMPGVLLAIRQRLSSLLSRKRYDVVHAHWLVPNGWLASAPAARRGVPLVVTLHGTDVAAAERVRVLHPLWRRAFARMGAVTASSENLCRRAERLGADPSTTSAVQLPVDTEMFAPRPVDRELRARFGAGDDALLVVAVGRLVEKKGFRYLIEAGSQVKGVHIALVGEGDLRPQLESIAARTGASVTFTGGLGHSGVADAFAAADVVAVPSVVDDMGNVDSRTQTLVEALSTGRPVIATAVGGIPEVLDPDVNGLLVPEKDVAALRMALTDLRDHEDLRERLGREARAYAVRELGFDATARAFEHAFGVAGATID